MLLSMLCMPYMALAVDSKPHVVVKFEVAVPAFARNLPNRTQTQDAIGQNLAQRIAGRYPFADWSIAPHSKDARLGSLVLRLEEDNSTAPNPRIVAVWYEQVDTPTAEPSTLSKLDIEPIEIYEATNPNWDTNDEKDFATRVTGKLAAAMRSDDFYALFFQLFVQHLSIASNVLAQANDRTIEMPMHWRDMLLAPESVVMVSFRKVTSAGLEKGSIRLSPVSARVQIQDAANNVTATTLRGTVERASFGPKALDLVQHWNDQLPELLRDAVIACFIVDYKRADDNGMLDGIALNSR